MAHFHRLFVMSNPQTSYPQTSYHICPILSNLISHCKVWALYMQNDGLSSPCMHDFAHKKSPKTREKLSIIVMLFYKTIIKFIENQEKRFVILQGVVLFFFIPRNLRHWIRRIRNSTVNDFGGGSKERKESLKSNNRIQHTCNGFHVIMKYFDISFRVMTMRSFVIKVCKVSWTHI